MINRTERIQSKLKRQLGAISALQGRVKRDIYKAAAGNLVFPYGRTVSPLPAESSLKVSRNGLGLYKPL